MVTIWKLLILSLEVLPVRQDLSVAGLRQGLAGQRSGLFMDQIRIIKEMRERDRISGRTDGAIRPRYCGWENVPGARSSGTPKGADFQAVLTEFIRVIEPEAPDVPIPEKGWPAAGCLYDELGQWSLAWSEHDAQYFGVAQRRKRICVLVDYGGLTAPWILFDAKFERLPTERESDETVDDSGDPAEFFEVSPVSSRLSGDSQPGGEERQGSAGGTESSTGDTGVFCFTNRGYDKVGMEVSDSLRSECHGAQPMIARSTGLDLYNQTIIGETAAPQYSEPIPIHDQATRYSGKRGDKRDGKGNGLGIGRPGDPAPTLSSGDHHAVYDANGSKGDL